MDHDIEARYHGTCPECPYPIEPGQAVTQVGVKWVHKMCALGANDPEWMTGTSTPVNERYRTRGKRKTPLCPQCFTEHNGECM